MVKRERGRGGGGGGGGGGPLAIPAPSPSAGAAAAPNGPVSSSGYGRDVDKAAEGYMMGLLEAQEREYATVMDAAFGPDGAHLVCGGDDGRLAVWEMGPFMSEECWRGAASRETASSVDMFAPDLALEVGDGAINCLKFMQSANGSNGSNLLLVGGDSRVSVWEFSRIQESLGNGTGDAPRALLELLPSQPRGYRGSMRPRPEVNGLAVNKERNSIVAACGDCRAHEWDLATQTLVRTYDGHTGYLHCTQVIPSASLMLTGGEDGQVGVWDSRMEKSVDFFKPVERMASAGLGKFKQLGSASVASSFVTSMQVDPAGNWLTCGGGMTQERGTDQGWIGLWHLPSRTVTSASSASSAVHAMVYSDEYLVTVGMEGYVRHWDWKALRLRSRTGASPLACYALAVNKHGPHKGITVVGGCSKLVDCYAYPGNISFSLQYQ